MPSPIGPADAGCGIGISTHGLIPVIILGSNAHSENACKIDSKLNKYWRILSENVKWPRAERRIPRHLIDRPQVLQKKTRERIPEPVDPPAESDDEPRRNKDCRRRQERMLEARPRPWPRTRPTPAGRCFLTSIEWERCRVGLDYHVEIAKHYYSVPHQLLRQEVEARITAAAVEIFRKRVASHRRGLRPHRPTTSPSTCLAPTGTIATGPMSASAARPKRSVPTPPCWSMSSCARGRIPRGFRSCVGILRLVKRYGADRVGAACARALVLGLGPTPRSSPP
jgi:hypothetical protein